jgi:hypothetical protein
MEPIYPSPSTQKLTSSVHPEPPYSIKSLIDLEQHSKCEGKTDESSFNFRQIQDICHFSKSFRPASRPDQPLIQWVLETFSSGVNGWSKMLTTHPHLLPKLWRSGTIPTVLHTSSRYVDIKCPDTAQCLLELMENIHVHSTVKSVLNGTWAYWKTVISGKILHTWGSKLQAHAWKGTCCNGGKKNLSPFNSVISRFYSIMEPTYLYKF